MSVEYIPFDPTLIGKEEIIIWCPNDRDYPALAELLEDVGVQWMGGESPTGWHGYDDHYDARSVDKDRYMMRASHGFYERETAYRDSVFMKWTGEQEVTVDVGDLI